MPTCLFIRGLPGSGQLDSVETAIFSAGDPADGATVAAVLLRHVVGMYVAADAPTPADLLAESQRRMAAACERAAKDGDEWKGD